MSRLDDLREIYPLTEAAYGRIEHHVERLREWQTKTNLVAPSTLPEIWQRHVADSLQCLAIKPDARQWLDLGSGGGFPGLVIAAVMADYPDSSVTLVESIAKKTAFLNQVNRQSGCSATIINGRIEKVTDQIKSVEVGTARALSSLSTLLEMCEPWIKAGAVGLFHKGRDYQAELAECDGLWTFDLVHHRSRISQESVILEISNLRRNAELAGI